MSRAEDIFQKLIYFGEDAIDEFIVNMQTEELFLDFKQAVSIGKNNGTTLHKDDRKNLAKCISGFGNSEGGVIIWGVECSRDIDIGDVAKAKVKVKNVYRFLSWLENAISGCTIPSHNGVRNHIISSDKDGNGYVEKDGEELVLKILIGSSSSTATASAMIDMWKAVGIHVELDPMESVSDKRKAGDFDILDRKSVV